MLDVSRTEIRSQPSSSRDLVLRFAEEGYQLEPEALQLICRHPGAGDDLMRRIIGSLDRSVAVISASQISGLLDQTAQKSGLPSGIISFPDQRTSAFLRSPLPTAPSHVVPHSSSFGVELNCDITGQSTCVGEYQDFVRYFRDRYAKMREILSRRLSARPIESLNKSTSGREVSLIGMVADIRNTAKGNRVIELEDPTGMITAIIGKDSEIFEQSGFIVPDEVVGVTGVSDGNGRLFVKSLLWPDMPNQTQPLEKGNGYALLLSDLHVGSKYFLQDAWNRFITWLNGEVDDPSGLASQVRYMVIAGDVADGIGIYPGQDKDLAIMDIYEQYEAAASCINAIRKDISVVMAPGNHDIVRQAEPQPALPEAVQKLFGNDTLFVGNPAWITLGGVPILVYHGRSIDDLILRVPGLSYAAPEKAMIEMLRRRHLSPIYGGRVSIAPEKEDHYVISRPPAVLHCGHVHTVGIARYKGVAVINSGTWQSQTDFQKKMNIQPQPAVVPLVDLATMKIKKLIFA